MTQKAFITGATGFVGGALSEQLAASGWQLVALARRQSDCSRLEKLGVTLARGDLCQQDNLIEPMRGCDVVFHCAALTGVGHTIADFHQVIAEGTRHLISAASAAGVGRFVYVSSVLAYEINGADQCYDESKPVLSSSIDPYGQAKVEAEAACLAAHRRGDIATCIVRPTFIYGPGDRPGGFLPELATMIQNGKFRLIGGGENSIPLVYISDLVDLLVACAERDEANGQIYNAVSQNSPSWRKLVSTLCEQLQLKMPGKINAKVVASIAGLFEFLAKRKLIQTLPISKAAVKLLAQELEFPASKAAQQLHFQPKVDFQQGITHCIPMLREILGPANTTS